MQGTSSCPLYARKRKCSALAHICLGPIADVHAHRIAAFKSLLAYSGKYRTEGNKVVIKVDIAADESWNGTEQVRYYKIDGDHIEAAPQPYPNFGGKVMRGILVWKRE